MEEGWRGSSVPLLRECGFPRQHTQFWFKRCCLPLRCHTQQQVWNGMCVGLLRSQQNWWTAGEKAGAGRRGWPWELHTFNCQIWSKRKKNKSGATVKFSRNGKLLLDWKNNWLVNFSPPSSDHTIFQVVIYSKAIKHCECDAQLIIYHYFCICTLNKTPTSTKSSCYISSPHWINCYRQLPPANYPFTILQALTLAKVLFYRGTFTSMIQKSTAKQNYKVSHI